MSASRTTPPNGADVDDMIARNPKVDRDQLEDVQRAFKALEKQGIVPTSYEIGSPHKRPARTSEAAPRAGRHGRP